MNLGELASGGVIIQGLTGRVGRVHARRMLDYGTPLVAGVVPGRSGSTVEGIPVFDTVYEARAETGSRCTVAFLPPTAAADGLVAGGGWRPARGLRHGRRGNARRPCCTRRGGCPRYARDWAELARRADPWRIVTRLPSSSCRAPRPVRGTRAERHPLIRGRVVIDAGGTRPEHVDRHWRGPNAKGTSLLPTSFRWRLRTLKRTR